MSDYPEHDKLREVVERSQALATRSGRAAHALRPGQRHRALHHEGTAEEGKLMISHALAQEMHEHIGITLEHLTDGLPVSQDTLDQLRHALELASIVVSDSEKVVDAPTEERPIDVYCKRCRSRMND